MSEPTAEEVEAIAAEAVLSEECPLCHRQVKSLLMWSHLASCMKKAAAR